MKNYYEFVNEAGFASFPELSDSILKSNPYEEKDLKKLSLLEIGKQGKLAEYIDKGDFVRFGMLKALYQDAIAYKKKREYEKGIAKFIVRAVPMALAPIFFPLWLISQILGSTRAINKIIIPSLFLHSRSYNDFLKSMITKTMNIAEGDIRPLLGNDWYYDVFYVHDGLIKMVRKEYVYEFTRHITSEIEKKGDDEIVPKYWLDNRFRKWLNEKFDIDLPTDEKMIRNKTS